MADVRSCDRGGAGQGPAPSPAQAVGPRQGQGQSPPRPSSPLSVGGLSTAATVDTAELFGEGRDELADALSGIATLSVGEDESPVSISAVAAGEKEDAAEGKKKIRLVYSDRFLEHRNPRGQHPECPERLEVIVAALKKEPALKDVLEWVEPTPVEVGSERRKLVLKIGSLRHTTGPFCCS